MIGVALPDTPRTVPPTFPPERPLHVASVIVRHRCSSNVAPSKVNLRPAPPRFGCMITATSGAPAQVERSPAPGSLRLAMGRLPRQRGDYRHRQPTSHSSRRSLLDSEPISTSNQLVPSLARFWRRQHADLPIWGVLKVPSGVRIVIRGSHGAAGYRSVRIAQRRRVGRCPALRIRCGSAGRTPDVRTAPQCQRSRRDRRDHAR